MRKWLYSILVLSLVGCKEPAPKPVMSDEQLARIMADLYAAEAATSGAIGYSKDSLMQAYFGQVFELHGVKKEDYEKDIRLLAEDIAHFEEVLRAAQVLLEPDTSKVKR